MITRAPCVAGWAALLLASSLVAGCITIYQPMTGLHRPVAIDPSVANFKDVAITLQCVPAEYVGKSDMAKLCRRVGRLFENQGARVTAQVSKGRVTADESEEPAPADGRITLDIELRSRRVHAQTVAPFWWDDEADITFAQDIVIRDETGFLLMRETITGRFVRRLGWSSDADEQFSRDYYGQLSQLAFNARMRWVVAGGGRGRAGAKPPPGAAGSPASAAPASPAPDPGGVPGGVRGGVPGGVRDGVPGGILGETLNAKPVAPPSAGGPP